MRQKKQIIGLVLVLWLCLVSKAEAQSPPPTPSDDQINAVAGELYCPVCENIPLDVCGTQACEQWRGVIRDKLAEGWSKDQIKQYFVDQYGDRVLATPPARGFNWLVYLVPPLVILGGVYILFKALVTWKKSEAPAESEQIINHDQDEYITRLEEELKNREQNPHPGD
jgi:cytochrome c-type biogenesis protein CcmH